MLDLIIKFEPYEIIINNQKITMELRPLRREQMILLSAMFDDIIDESPKVLTSKNKKMAREQIDIENNKRRLRQYNKSLEYQKYANAIFPEHVRNIQGLRINGAAPTPDDFANEPALCNVTIDVIGGEEEAAIIAETDLHTFIDPNK